MTYRNTNKTLLGCFGLLVIAAATGSTASAQRASSGVDIFRGGAGANASADGMFKFARTNSSSNNGVQFGHGLAVGAGPNGIAVSNSIGGGAGPLGAAHNVNLNIGTKGTHISHGGVVSQGGNRRVTSGGGTGIQNGRVYGGSRSRGYGNHTKAYSKSHTRNWVQPSYQPSYQRGYSNRNSSRSGNRSGRVINRFRSR